MATIEEQIARIEKAFAGVELEDGVGLYESQGLDDYLSREECAALRAKDEKHDWHKIPIIDLYRCGSCLSFFDAKGVRFHLPQIMLHCLGVYAEEDERLYREGETRHRDSPDLQWHLTHLERFDHYYSALDAEQIGCVIDFLEYIRDNAEELYAIIMAKSIMVDDLEEIEKALPVWRTRQAALRKQEAS